ncbi:37S ribosomal protein S22 [Gryganskiella cystojenkinii]|nr:37S ribosomal protein S22 [Gryganskiella cystojenkinii]
MAALQNLLGTGRTQLSRGAPTYALLDRFAGLSLRNSTHQQLRGYVRAARSRPLTPRAPTWTLPPSAAIASPSLSSATSASSKSTVVKKSPKFKSELEPRVKLPNGFKLAKFQEVTEYDPNMIIFLDKQGNVKMIPRDDRVTGETKAARDAAMAAGVDADLEDSHQEPHQRGSKEAEYGRKRIGQVEIPVEVQDAIRSVIDEHDKSLIRADALRLYGSLRSTGSLDEDDLIDGSTSGSNSVTKRMKSGSKALALDQVAPAHILEYGHRESKAYIAAMAPTTYSAIKNVLEEVHKRVPDLRPKTMLDFGTGPGTAIWAANQVWNDQSVHCTGIDSSMAMLETAEDIMESMADSNAEIKNVTFKPFMSHGPKAAKYDVVMSAFALSELTTPALRKSTLEHLWQSTNDMLILIDRGTPSGFKILAEAREQILGLDVGRFKSKPKYDAWGVRIPEEPTPEREPAHVLAPCPHDKVCPMYASLSRDTQWCHFSQKLQRPDFLRKTKHSSENFEDAKYTYVILRKGTRPSYKPKVTPPTAEITAPGPTTTNTTTTSSDNDESTSQSKKKFKKPPPPPPVTYETAEEMLAASHDWSRIVVPPLKKDGHVVIDTCAASGSLERIIIPKSQGKIQYRDARKSAWGDLFPHQPKNKPVRKESVQMEGGPGEGDEQQSEGDVKDEGGYKRRRPLDISAEKLLKRMKQKEKKQSRQKVLIETSPQLQNQAGDSSLKGKKGKKVGVDDITIDL